MVPHRPPHPQPRWDRGAAGPQKHLTAPPPPNTSAPIVGDLDCGSPAAGKHPSDSTTIAIIVLMRPAALHRSLTFWAGLLTIIFLVWAWWDSRDHTSWIRWKQLSACNSGEGALICREAGATTAFDTGRRFLGGSSRSPVLDFRPPFLVFSQGLDPQSSMIANSMKEAHQLMVNVSPPGSWYLYIPHWLILLPIITTWSLLLWRAGRHRRAANLTTLPAPPA